MWNTYLVNLTLVCVNSIYLYMLLKLTFANIGILII